MRYSIKANRAATSQGKTRHASRMPKKPYKHDGGIMSAWVKGVAKRLVWAREIAGGTQPQAYKFFGVDQSTWHGYENAERAVPVTLALRLCEEWGITLDYLYLGKLNSTVRQDVALRLAAEHPELVLGAPEAPPVLAKAEAQAS